MYPSDGSSSSSSSSSDGSSGDILNGSKLQFPIQIVIGGRNDSDSSSIKLMSSKPLISALDEAAVEHNAIAESFRHCFEHLHRRYIVEQEQPPSLTYQFDHLDHTADLQIHSWGDNFADTLASAVYGLFSYITDISKVSITEMRLFHCKGIAIFE